MIKQLSRIIVAMLVMTGRVTVLGLSRWGEGGCSYRTVQRVLGFTAKFPSLSHLVLDGEYGHNAAARMTQQCQLHLISKFRHDAALYLPYAGDYAGRGRHRKYGDKLKASLLKVRSRLPAMRMALKHAPINFSFGTPSSQPYSMSSSWSKSTWQPSSAHVILFSTDLALPADKIIQLYALRFQIEFNFRGAKQFWGLEDFMNIQPAPVLNATSLSLFMTAISARLLRDFRHHSPQAGVLDLKAVFHGQRYALEALKFLPHFPEPVLVSQIFAAVSNLGRIHSSNIAPRSYDWRRYCLC